MTTAVTDFYVTGGTLPRDAASYIVRKADTDLLEGLRAGQFCYVLTSRQMGKSSLMVRTVVRLRQEGVTCAVLDLTAIGQNLTEEQWYDGLLNLIGPQVALEDELEDYWLAHRRFSPLQRWMGALQEVLLQRLPGPLALFVDEIDAVRSLPFSADEFFAGIRECYNRRAQDQEYERLTFCLLGVATPSDLIRDTRMTPFNIGRRIELNDFTPEEAAPLAAGLVHHPPAARDTETQREEREEQNDSSFPQRGRAAEGEGVCGEGQTFPSPYEGEGLGVRLLSRILYWTGGHPYLTQRLCRAIAELTDTEPRTPNTVDRLCETLFLSSRARERDDNLLFVRERLLRGEADLASLLELYAQVREGKRVRDEEGDPLCGILRLAGIIRVVEGYLWLRNRIYYRVFDREWVRRNMPDAELRRQRAAYRRGVLRAASVGGAVIVALASLTLFAFTQRRHAETAQRNSDRNAGLAKMEALTARRYLYAANMALVQQAWDKHDFRRVRELLEELRPTPGQPDLRGWEWEFFWRRGHFDLPFLPIESYVFHEVAFSPDDTRMATGNGHGTIILWDAGTGHQIRLWEIDPKRPIEDTALEFSPDGKALRVNVTSAPGKAIEYDVETGRKLREIMHKAPPKASNFDTITVISPDGRLQATYKNNWDDDPEVRDRSTGRLRFTLPKARGPLVFSPDGKMLATNGNHEVWLWDMTTGSKKQTLLSAQEPFVFSHDGKRVAAQTSSYGWGIKIWDMTETREPIVVQGTEDEAAISPDGRILATVVMHDQEKNYQFRWSVLLWDMATLQQVGKIEAAQGPMTFSPDGRTLAMISTGSDSQNGQEILLRDIRTGSHRTLPGTHFNAVEDLVFAQDSKTLAISDQGTLSLREIATGRELRAFKEQYGRPAFSPDGRTVAILGKDGISLRDVDTGRETGSLPGANQPIAFSRDGRQIATASTKPIVLLWDARTGKNLFTLTGYKYPVQCLDFSPDGIRLVAGDTGEYTVKVWDTTSGREVFTLPGKTDRTDVASYSLFFTPDGKHLVSGNQDNKIKIW